MPYLVSTAVALLTAAAIVYVGPIGVLPAAYLAVLGPAGPPNERISVDVSYNLVCALWIGFPIIAWFALAFIVPVQELRAVLFEVSEIAAIKTNLVNVVGHYYTEDFNFGKRCRICYRSYGIFLLSIIPTIVVIIYYGSRLNKFRINLRKFTAGMYKKSDYRIEVSRFLMIAILIVSLTPTYILSRVSKDQVTPRFLQFILLGSSATILITFSIGILFCSATLRLKSARIKHNEDKQ